MHQYLLVALTIFAICTTPSPARAADYHLNSHAGNDTASGTSPQTAWRTIARLERQNLLPGDVVHFAAGGEWRQSLTLRHSGTTEKPIRYVAESVDGAARPAIVADRDYCIDASVSHVSINGLVLAGARGKERGAVMIWADRDLSGIRIEACDIYGGAGRGIWIAGDAGKRVTNVTIYGNTIHDNAGSGVQATKLVDSAIESNELRRNCRETIEPWQAGIRVWSPDVSGLAIKHNHIDGQRWFRDAGAAYGIHVDETGPGVEVHYNDVYDGDAAAILIENTRGVEVIGNHVEGVHTGIFVYRAGHDHTIDKNYVRARDLGIVLQGHRANGVNAGPEILVNDKLFSNNVVARSDVIVDRYAALKCIGGAESADTRYDTNDFGPDRRSLFEWGGQQFDTAAAFKAKTGITARPPGGQKR
ncbi:MAG TPA: right-handed parallel beta-helix repeat-containing protein [Tepidisphaeraceae bacterium]|jgi:nitrous oxidase accessory protein NosD